jgi:general secretion pathway protein E
MPNVAMQRRVSVCPTQDGKALLVGPQAPIWGLAYSLRQCPTATIAPTDADTLEAALEAMPTQSVAAVVEGVALGSAVSALLIESLEQFGGDDGLEDDAPVIRMVNAILTEAVSRGASDVHFEPYEAQAMVRLRIDGVLVDLVSPPRTVYAALISRIKVMAQLDIAERRLPQDGRMTIRLPANNVDLRVSTLPTAHGERAVLRLLQKTAGHVRLEGLGMSELVQSQFQMLLARPNGIVLVTGPTGSGKTTTLYAALSWLSTRRENIMTVEDPVEYEMPGISQTPVSPKIGLTFASALRAILRQDPDILMIGEIRDIETAQIAVQAALTGHLVLATLHTNDAASAVTRLLDMGVEPFLLSSTLHGVIGQRLVRQLCDACKRGMSGGLFEPAPEGCSQCNATGYRGRLGVYELMVVTPEIQSAMKQGADAPEIRRLASKAGLVEMAQDATRWLAVGQTSEQEVARVVMLGSE